MSTPIYDLTPPVNCARFIYMDLRDAQNLAHDLINQHLYGKGWRFAYDNAKSRLGVCKPATRTISLSRPLTYHGSEAQVRNTILHEIAHAMVGPGHGHDWMWKSQARAIGCDGRRCGDVGTEVQHQIANYFLVCPNCDRKSPRNRMTKTVKACGACCAKYNHGRFDARFTMRWVRNSVAS